MAVRPGKCVDDVLPLSPTQQGMVFHALFDERAPDVYIGQMVLTLAGPLDPPRLRRAAQRLLTRHANLRAGFRTVSSGQHVQVIRREVDLPWREVDLTGSAGATAADEFDRLLARDRSVRFDLARPPLLRCLLVRSGAEEHRLVISSHHLLWDGWSAPILVRELFMLYRAENAELPGLRPFRDYLAWLAGQDQDEARQVWREALAGVDEPTLLVPEARHGQPEFPERITLDLAEATTEALTRVARERGWTVSTVVQGLWALLLAKLTGRTDIVFGATVSGRPPQLAEVESMVGLFVNTVPVRVRIRRDESVAALLSRLRMAQSRLLDHQHLGLAEIQRLTGQATLFDTLVVFESYPLDEEALTEAAGPEGPRLTGITVRDATHYPLTLLVFPGQRLRLSFDYRPAALDESKALRIGGWFQCLVEAFVADPDRPIARLDLVDYPGRTAERTAPDIPLGRDVPLVRDMFAAQAARTPDAVAVVSGETALSYAELDERAERAAAALRARGIGPESTVAVALPRSVHLVVALLAVLKSGAAYLPVDTTYPRARIEAMLTEAEPHLVIREPGDLDGATASTAPVGDELAPEHPAYLIFTSGSTGRPKAVVGTQRALANRLSWGVEYFSGFFRGAESAGPRLAKSPLSFIDGTTELLGGLVAGETVVLADDATATDPLALADLVDRHGARTVTVVPSLLATLVENAPTGSLASVSTWISSGEQLPAALADAVTRRWPHARLVNLYGCSEAAGDSLAWIHSSDSAASTVPVGRPITGTEALVLDQFLRPAPAGVVGELYLAGAGLARGYLGQPDRTAERFVANPFGPPGTRLYRTGDLAVQRADGVLDLVGRVDHQVKIRGFRVEPAEVEAALRELPEVRAAVVAAHTETAAGATRLTAYVVPRTDALDPRGVRRELSTLLPAHLVPAVVMVLDGLPLTPSGKVDRRALPAPDFGKLTSAEGPRTEREKVLCELFARVLGLPAVGVHDSFFELGGDSIMSVRLVGLARRAGLAISPKDVFTHQTVAELAGVTDAPVADFTPTDRPLVTLNKTQMDKVAARWSAQ